MHPRDQSSIAVWRIATVNVLELQFLPASVPAGTVAPQENESFLVAWWPVHEDVELHLAALNRGLDISLSRFARRLNARPIPDKLGPPPPR
jgi:hypothetical protein